MKKFKITKQFIAQIMGSRMSMPEYKKSILGYKKIADRKEFAIYERPIGADKIIAAYGDAVVKKRGDKCLIYIPNARLPWINYHIVLDERNFPGLLDGSTIVQCLLLPYLRSIKKDTYYKDVRLCIFTNKAQIYHNNPARGIEYEGLTRSNDITRFEESVVWDIPGRKYPSKNEHHESYEVYYPGLPEQCYVFSPKANTDATYIDVYGNGGFGKSTKVLVNGKERICSRFYKHSTSEKSNPYMFIGTGVKNDKVNMIGTYRANVKDGVRICLFATSNGGREWYCKYEFSDMGEYEFQQGYSGLWGSNFGNKISVPIDIVCDKAEFILCKRNIVLPQNNDGCVETKFIWTKVSDELSFKGKDGLLLQTRNPHGLKTGNIVAVHKGEKNSKDIPWFVCSNMNEYGTVGGIQFKVRVIDNNTLELLELVSSSEPTLPCRHIHHINLHKDGWVVGTGEIYPNGWLLYIQQRMADTYSKVSASDIFKIVRINTCKDSVQRTMGLVMKDNFDGKIIFASDHDTLNRIGTGSTIFQGLKRGSLGVYVGKLKDIDDLNLFECVYEANEPCYFFQQLGDMLLFAGQRGELAISIDPENKNWFQERLGRFIMNFYGQFHNFYCFNDYIIMRK